MKANDPKALKALAALGAGYAVIYLPGDPEPKPLTTAGEFRGRAFYMVGPVAHWIADGLKAEATADAIAYTDAKGLVFYVTDARNAPEVQPGRVVLAIDTSREELEAGVGMAFAVQALDPLGEDDTQPGRPPKGKAVPGP